ncbi:MAG: minor capsid protein [Sarcina sp.]
MGNRDYWQKRVSKETWDLYNNLEKNNKELRNFYNNAIKDIEREIAITFAKINNGNPTLSDMYKYDRLNKLKANMNNVVKNLSKEIDKHTKNQISNAIKKEYKKIGKLLNLDFAMPNEKLMEMLMSNPWSGEVFSNRIWENNRVLAKNLNEILTRGLAQGKTVKNITDEMVKKMNSSLANTHRLVRTETMHFLNESCKERYKDADIKYVEMLAAEDERTCSICGEEHLKKYKIDEAPTLPLHPNCRCTIIPIIKE